MDFLILSYDDCIEKIREGVKLNGTKRETPDYGAFVETNSHGITGYRCSSFDEYLEAIEKIDEISSSNCLQWAMKNFTMEIAYKKYINIFDRFS